MVLSFQQMPTFCRTCAWILCSHLTHYMNLHEDKNMVAGWPSRAWACWAQLGKKQWVEAVIVSFNWGKRARLLKNPKINQSGRLEWSGDFFDQSDHLHFGKTKLFIAKCFYGTAIQGNWGQDVKWLMVWHVVCSCPRIWDVNHFHFCSYLYLNFYPN